MDDRSRAHLGCQSGLPQRESTVKPVLTAYPLLAKRRNCVLLANEGFAASMQSLLFTFCMAVSPCAAHFTARTLPRTECKTVSTARPPAAFRQFVCRTTGTSRKSRLERDRAPNRLPEATAAPGCFFVAMTPSPARWQLGPRHRALAPLLVRIAGDARCSGAGHAGGLPTVP